MPVEYENLSVVIMAKDAEADMAPCIESVKGAGEIIVADTGSTDRTREIALKMGANVVGLEWKGFGRTRANAFAVAAREWILWLDSDERVSPELWEAFGGPLGGEERNPLSGFEIRRRANFLGHWMRGGGWGRDWVLRLFRNGLYTVDERNVHEGVSLEGSTGRLEGVLLHYTDPTLSHYLRKFNSYTTLAARDLHEAGRRTWPGDIIVRPPWTFLRMYVLKGGFVDGIPGLVLAGLSGTYVFVKYIKLWELNRGKDEAIE